MFGHKLEKSSFQSRNKAFFRHRTNCEDHKHVAFEMYNNCDTPRKASSLEILFFPPLETPVLTQREKERVREREREKQKQI